MDRVKERKRKRKRLAYGPQAMPWSTEARKNATAHLILCKITLTVLIPASAATVTMTPARATHIHAHRARKCATSKNTWRKGERLGGLLRACSELRPSSARSAEEACH